jgi:hypothetical protein
MGGGGHTALRKGGRGAAERREARNTARDDSELINS